MRGLQGLGVGLGLDLGDCLCPKTPGGYCLMCWLEWFYLSYHVPLCCTSCGSSPEFLGSKWVLDLGKFGVITGCRSETSYLASSLQHSAAHPKTCLAATLGATLSTHEDERALLTLRTSQTFLHCGGTTVLWCQIPFPSPVSGV